MLEKINEIEKLYVKESSSKVEGVRQERQELLKQMHTLDVQLKEAKGLLVTAMAFSPVVIKIGENFAKIKQ